MSEKILKLSKEHAINDYKNIKYEIVNIQTKFNTYLYELIQILK